MRHHNSVFHGLIQHVPWAEFERLVEAHKADHRVRRLDTKSQFLALLFGQFSGAQSLREIEAGLISHANRLYHLGAKRAARSTLADANAGRPWQVFADLFAVMAARAGRGTRRKLADAVRLLDATKVRLSGIGSQWAQVTDSECAAKLHLVYDPVGDRPLRAEVTPAVVNDITPAKAFPIEPGATYVFDLAYYDYGWWAQLDAQGCRFVTRLKKNTVLSETTDRELSEEAGKAGVLSEKTGLLPRRLAYSRTNPMSGPVRELRVRISTGKQIRLLTNDLESPAQDIAELYKQRWQIELFFKWLKQNLKIKHFLGVSENAVRIQIFVALIAFLILAAAQSAQNSVTSLQKLARLVRLNLMHRRSLDALQKPYTPPPIDQRQLQWNFAPC